MMVFLGIACILSGMVWPIVAILYRDAILAAMGLPSLLVGSTMLILAVNA